MKNFLLISLLTFGVLVHASVIPKNLNCSQKGTDIIFVNGVNYTENFVDDITHGMIENKVPPSYFDSKKDENSPEGSFVEFRYVYNYSAGYSAAGLTLDFTESVAQKLALLLNIPVDEAFVLVYYYAFEKFLGNEFISSVLGNLAKAFSWTFLENFISQDLLKEQLKEQLSQFSSDNTKLKSEISRTLLSGKKLILFSESQGNLFVNTAIRDFLNGEQLSFPGIVDVKSRNYYDYTGVIGHVQVATPTNSLISKKTLSLNDEDIINIVFLDSPKSNFPFTDPENDPRPILDQYLDHFIWSTYLNYYNVETGSLNELRNFTLQALVDAASLLDSNCKSCKDSDGNEFEAVAHKNPDDSIGGLVSIEAYASPTATIGPNAVVCSYARIEGNAKILDNAFVDNYAIVQGEATVSQWAKISDLAFVGANARISGEAFIGQNAIVYDNAKITDSAIVVGDTSVWNYSTINGSALIYDNANIHDSATISGRANVGGNTFVGEKAVVTDFSLVSGTGNVTVAGTAEIHGSSMAFDNAFITGNARLYQSSLITGNARITDNAIISGTSHMFGSSIAFESARVENNTRMADYSFISGRAKLQDSAVMFDRGFAKDDTIVKNSAAVSGDAFLIDHAQMSGAAHIFGYFSIYEFGQMRDSSKGYNYGRVSGSAIVSNNAHVFGTSHLFDYASMQDNALLSGNARAGGNARIFGSAHVSGSTALSWGAVVCGSSFVSTGSINDNTYCK